MKAVLVIDMPKTCNECPLRYFKQGDYCCVTKALIEDGINCPLKPMPQKVDVSALHPLNDTLKDMIAYGMGYNALHDEITGETE